MLVASILLFTLGASASAPSPALSVQTAKSLDQFASCFTSNEDRAGRAWAFVPGAHGGVFTNGGAENVKAIYRLRFSESKSRNRLRLFADGPASSLSPLIEAAERCR